MKNSQAIERMRQVLRRQHKSLATEDTYVCWLRRYISALHSIPADLPSEKKLERFLTELAVRDQVAASTQNQAFHAVIFFYKEVLGQPLGNVNALRAKRPVHTRHPPTLADTQLLLQTVRDVGGYPTNLVTRLLYGCGLRVSEPLNLRVKDVNLEQFKLCIRGAKGGDDRFVALPATLVPELITQIERARVIWHQDHQDGTPVALPHRLARKYPEYRFTWSWAWLFPAHNICRDPRTNKLVRFRMHEANVQRAVKYARRKLGIPLRIRQHMAQYPAQLQRLFPVSRCFNS